jgi:hypothetical protein
MKLNTPFESLESRLFMSFTPGSAVHPAAPQPTVVVPAVTAPALSARALSVSEVLLTWQGGTGASMFTIQRSTNGKTGWNNDGVTASGIHSFVDANVSGKTKYYYRVVAAGTGGAVAFSNVTSVFVPAV